MTADDTTTGQKSARKVVSTIRHAGAVAALVAVSFAGGGVAHATAEHPFMVAESNSTVSRQVFAENLKAGDQVRDENGATKTVVATKSFNWSGTLFNLTVDADHTYLVADGSGPAVLVHNCETVSDTGNEQVRVGRWMGDNELKKMQRTGEVQVSFNSETTHVAHPADIPRMPNRPLLGVNMWSSTYQLQLLSARGGLEGL